MMIKALMGAGVIIGNDDLVCPLRQVWVFNRPAMIISAFNKVRSLMEET